MKRIIRVEKRKLRENLSEEEIRYKSKKITQSFLNSIIYKESKVIMSYMNIKNEVETKDINKKILKDEKILLIPVIEKEEIVVHNLEKLDLCKTGEYNILEPLENREWKDHIDLIIVPGVAFDKKGNRIGFGKGYYDRFLIKHIKAIKIAILYDFQLCSSIVEEKHDIKMDFLLSNKGWEK